VQASPAAGDDAASPVADATPPEESAISPSDEDDAAGDASPPAE
jgi:hypothetical protein